MNKYHVEINFKKGPSYSSLVYAKDAESAQRKVKAEAAYAGLTEAVKKFTVRRIENEEAAKLIGIADCAKGTACSSSSLDYLEGYAEQYASDQQQDHKTVNQEITALAKLIYLKHNITKEQQCL
jgi:hypothetical protein